MRMIPIVMLAGTAVLFAAPKVWAASAPCPNPQALGVSREMEVGGAAKIGLKTYPQTLDLKDHEVVLTFDDGPSRKTTPQVLDALEHECVTANFFLIGRNAASAPALVKREVADGDSVGHHSFSHPAITLRGLSDAAARADIDKGIEADDTAAYGSYAGHPRVPFFRFPGFADTTALLDYLGEEKIAVFGADLWASDWVPMTPEVELALLMKRLDGAGRGIILLHDTKEQTASMLPQFLEALKAGGYHVVHVVPGEGPTETRPAPANWSSETERIITHMWPKSPARRRRRDARAEPDTAVRLRRGNTIARRRLLLLLLRAWQRRAASAAEETWVPSLQGRFGKPPQVARVGACQRS